MLFLGLCVTQALAEDDVSHLLGSGMPADSVETAFNAVVDAVKSRGETVAGELQRSGDILFAGLGVIAAAWMAFQLLTEGVDAIGRIMTPLIRLVMLMGFVYFMLKPEGFDLIFRNGIVGSIDRLAEDIMPGAASVQTAVSQFVIRAFQQMAAIYDSLTKALDCSGWLEGLDCLGSAVELTPALIVLGLVFLLLAAAGMMFAVIATASLFLIQIALIMAPIMIPWLLLEQTRDMFWGWLKFLIAAGLTKLLAVLVIGFGLAAMDATLAKVSDPTTATFVTAMAMLMTIMVMNTVLLRINKAAKQLAH